MLNSAVAFKSISSTARTSLSCSAEDFMSALFVFTQEGSSVKSKSFLHANSLVQNFFSVVDLSIFNSKSKNSLYSRVFLYSFESGV